VRPACHVRLGFGRAAPPGAELLVEHLRGERLLARECRPLAAGVDSVGLKTHPKGSRIRCLLRTGGLPVEKIRFSADSGPAIEPTGRNFIVMGAMKAGTTSLFELLARHPALCRTWTELPKLSFPKEINYFLHLYRKGHSAVNYDWRFPFDAVRHAWTLEVSPGYTKWPKSNAVPARIASLGGDTRLAYILRDPVDRIESHLAHNLEFRGKVTSLRHCIRTSSYAMQLDKFARYFSPNDILLLDFEQLCREPGAILARICNHLGIEPIASTGKIHNTRGIDFKLDGGQRAELRTTLRPDVERLLNDYGFEPAEKWLDRVD
jgi:hypothetical protein